MTNSPPRTLRSLAGARQAAPMQRGSALIIIDAQREYDEEGLLPLHNLEPALDNISRLQEVARQNQIPLLHVVHHGKAGGTFDPSLGGRTINITGPRPGEAVVAKGLPNSFAGTSLHEHLSDEGITNLVIAGFMTHMCVSSTARAALDLGYETSVISDACTTRDLPGIDSEQVVPAAEVHRTALAALADRFSNVLSTSNLLELSMTEPVRVSSDISRAEKCHVHCT